MVLQADPFVQSPSNSQNFNRYSYVLNNPLSYTDPSGYLFKKLNKVLGKFAPFVAIAIMFIPGGQGIGAAMLKGFIAGGIASGSLKGAVVGAFSAGIGFGGDLGFIGNGMVGGLSSKVMGGKFGHGFWSAGISSKLAPGIQNNVSNSYASVAIHAIVGGTISKATGGKFANGAYSAAFASALREALASASRTGVGSSSEAETDATKQNREAFEARIKELVNDGTIDPKKTFLTMDLAAKEILGVLSPLYEQYGLEAGGYIVKNG